MVDAQSFNAAEFFDGEQNLPTILEGDEQRSNLVNSPPTSPEPNKSNAEEPKSNTATTLSNGTNTPDTDKTAVEGNASSESPITPSSRSNTPSSEKGSKSKNKSSHSSPTSCARVNSRSSTPDINRISRRKNREATSTPTGSRTTSRSRSHTPDVSKRKNTTGFLQTENHEMKPIREPLTSANFIHIGVPGEINFPSANIRELTIGVFHIFNPTEKQISWSLTPADKAMFRRLGTATNAAVEVDDNIFNVTKPRGFLEPKHAERVDVHFIPLGVGSYSQTFVLEDASGTDNGVDAVSMKFQGVATENTFSVLLQKHKPSKKEVKFEIEESEIKMPPTRVGKQRSMGIKILNVSKESIRLTCKVDTSTGPGGKFVLSLPMNSVVVKPDGFAIIPVRFQPRAEGEVKGIVTIQAINNAEVKVDVTAKGVLDNRHTA